MKGYMCYSFKFKVEKDGELNNKEIVVNIVATNYDAAHKKIKQWEEDQQIILKNLTCINDIPV